MPQTSIEYTSNIVIHFEFNKLFLAIHEAINTITGIKIENCKTRVIKLENYFISHGETNEAFVHTEIRFIEGRSPKKKVELGEKVLKVLKTFFLSDSNKNDIQITVFIDDFPKKYYFKHPPGTLTP